MTLLIECIIAITIFTAIVIPVALKNPVFIAGDYPPEIVKKCIELKIIPERKTRWTKRELIKKAIACIFIVTILTLVVYKINEATTFFEGFINAYIIWLAVCWYDALVLDCIFFCNFKRFRIPETEDMKEYKNYWFHIIGSIRGSIIGILACLLIGILVTII